jgi:hypothetical protein
MTTTENLDVEAVGPVPEDEVITVPDLSKVFEDDGEPDPLDPDAVPAEPEDDDPGSRPPPFPFDASLEPLTKGE